MILLLPAAGSMVTNDLHEPVKDRGPCFASCSFEFLRYSGPVRRMTSLEAALELTDGLRIPKLGS